jgi:hypothetical protein
LYTIFLTSPMDPFISPSSVMILQRSTITWHHCGLVTMHLPWWPVPGVGNADNCWQQKTSASKMSKKGGSCHGRLAFEVQEKQKLRWQAMFMRIWIEYTV